MSDPIPAAVTSLRRWGEGRDWRGYDPYDGLTSPLAGALSLNTALGRRVVTQAVKLSPVNLRPALRIRPAWNAKAVALVASAYSRLAATGDVAAAQAATRWLDWLESNHRGGPDGMAWGYHFEVQTRVFRYPPQTPNAIATSFAAHAFMDALELAGDHRREEAVRDAAGFLVGRMRQEDPGGAYFTYLPGSDGLVHNANLLVCAVLARAARLLGDDSLVAPARDPLETSLAAQRPDGSWPYARGGHDWVDNFHTAYVLDSLAQCAPSVEGVGPALAHGVEFWDREMFLEDGTPKYFPDRALPEDAHCHATAVDTWLALDATRPDAQAKAERAARLLVSRMLDPRGHMRFQRRRLWTSKVPYVRWTTAPAFKALAGVMLAREQALGASRAEAT